MALLRLLFLTRLEDPKRRWRRAWLDGHYIAAATRGLALRQNELLRLQTISAEYATCSRNLQDIIDLIRAQTPAEWENLLEAFESLNHALPPECVRDMVAFVQRRILEAQRPAVVGTRLPASSAHKKQVVAPGPRAQPSEATSSKDLPSRAITCVEQPPAPSAAQSSDGVANRRDLGALTGMFDDD